MVTYQKKNSVYVQKQSCSAQEKENQSNIAHQMSLKDADSSTCANKGEAYTDELPH
jgi:hypothetical protein